jgi:hypothetical protein
MEVLASLGGTKIEVSSCYYEILIKSYCITGKNPYQKANDLGSFYLEQNMNIVADFCAELCKEVLNI